MSSIILAGFMGTGKSAVGREVAQRLGRLFVDTDVMVEDAAGATVAQIFANRGEAEFRAQERQAVSAAAATPDAVIAVGGGTLLDPENRAALEAAGLLVCLDADESELVARLATTGDRPLLAGGDAASRIRDLLAARAAHYDSIPWHVDTTGRTVDEVAQAVLLRYSRLGTPPARSPESAQVRVGIAGAEYTVSVGAGLLSGLGARLAGLGLTGQIVVVAQPMPRALFWPEIRRSLVSAGLDCHIAEIPDGEGHKTLATVAALYERFSAIGLDRSAAIVALGGGVTGDVAGFAAATYLRGLPFIQAPTTLLAMVDASVGGKTGVDLPAGKNLVGAFYQPRGVVCDVATLATLPETELRCGLAEALKTALLSDGPLFEVMEATALAGTSWPLAEIVERCVRVKARVVEADPQERGLRAILNLGHTIGHGVEQASGYRYRHGEAVSIGLVGAVRLAVALGRCEPGLAGRVQSVLARIGLPVWYEGLEPASVLAAMQSDKKRLHGRLRWVLPLRPGEVTVTDQVPPEMVQDVVAGLAS